MKKRIKYIFLLTIFLIFCNKVDALSVARNPLTISEGSSDTVEIYANVGDNTVSEIKFTLIYYSDNAKASFIPAGGTNCDTVNSTHTITFSEGKSGRILLGQVKITISDNAGITSASAYAHAAFAKTVDGDIINLNNVMINVNINNTTPSTTEPVTTEPTTTVVVEPTTTASQVTTTEKTTTKTTTTTTTTTKPRENKGLLKEINSKIVTINLEDDVYEYTVNVSETLEELDLVPVANDEDTKIEISSQKLSELDEKKITITLSNGNDKEKYVIKVNVVPKPTVKPVAIDDTNFVEKNGYKAKWIIVIILLGTLLIFSILFLNNKKK